MKTIKIIKAANKDPKLIRKAIRENTNKEEIKTKSFIHPKLVDLINALRAIEWSTFDTSEEISQLAQKFKLFPIQIATLKRLSNEIKTEKTKQDQ